MSHYEKGGFMKKMAEIMEELGFRPDASDDVKKAFVKNLIKQAHITEFQRAKIAEDTSVKTESETVDKFEQISLFDQKLSS